MERQFSKRVSDVSSIIWFIQSKQPGKLWHRKYQSPLSLFNSLYNFLTSFRSSVLIPSQCDIFRLGINLWMQLYLSVRLSIHLSNKTHILIVLFWINRLSRKLFLIDPLKENYRNKTLSYLPFLSFEIPFLYLSFLDLAYFSPDNRCPFTLTDMVRSHCFIKYAN